MPSPIVIPEQYGLVIGVAVSTLFVNVLHVMKVVQGRYKYGIKAPAVTASPEDVKRHPDARLFDNAFRAHANFNENLPHFLIAMGVTGLKYPVVSAALGGVWILGRVLYFFGYTGKKSIQARGTGFALATYTQLGLTFSAAYAAYTFIF